MTGRHIYVVDDDDALRQSIELVLNSQMAVTIESFASGEDFLERLSDLAPGCLLLDLNMPGMGGQEVLREVKTRDGSFETIVLTGEGDIGRAVDAMKAGAGDFLEKPCNPETLISAIEIAFHKIEDRARAAQMTRTARDQIERLTPRERDVLMGLVDGKANKIIAYELDISPRTVEIYRAHLMEKLGVRSVAEATRIAFASGLVPLMPQK